MKRELIVVTIFSNICCYCLAFTIFQNHRFGMQRRTHKLIYNNLLVPHRPFYRSFPYRGGVSAASADSRGCVDLDLGFFFNRIPKAGNSTVTTTLARLKLGHDVPSKRAKKVFSTPAQLNRAQLGELDQLFAFTFVRNPYTRVLSAYLDKLGRGQSRADQVRGFSHFIRRLETGALHKNAHWAPQTDLLLLPRERFDFIGKTESLNQDVNSVLNRLGRQSDQGIQQVLSNATGASKKLEQFYQGNLAQRVLHLYRDDFANFNYSPAFPPT
ncbi:sulfotransferase family protein [Oceanococcus atlanticus]|nr:sulfotransferase family protein [Oceanococcus atlanticus]